jgi:hypothetical protein
MTVDAFGRRRPSSLDEAAARIFKLLIAEERDKKSVRRLHAGESYQVERGQPDAETGDDLDPRPFRGPDAQKEFQESLDGRAPRGDVNQMTRIETLRRLVAQGRLSDASLAAAKDMASKLYAPNETEMDKEFLANFLDATIADPALAEASVKWITPSMTTENPQAREEALRRLATLQAQIYGYPTPTLDVELLPGNIGGNYKGAENRIRINSIGSTYEYPRPAFSTTAHEGGHAFQKYLADGVRSGHIAIGHPLYPLAEIMRLNNRFYTERRDDPTAYKRQPMEQHANQLKAAVDERLLKYWRSRWP